MEHTISKFADDTNLGGVVCILEGRTAVQRDWSIRIRLMKWADKRLMRFSMKRHKVLHLEWNSFMK